MVNVRLLAVLVAVVVIAGVAVLAYTTLGSVTVEKPYYAETPKAIAVYMKIHNGKLREVCLVKAELAEPGMAKVEIHETVMEGGGSQDETSREAMHTTKRHTRNETREDTT